MRRASVSAAPKVSVDVLQSLVTAFRVPSPELRDLSFNLLSCRPVIPHGDIRLDSTSL